MPVSEKNIMFIFPGQGSQYPGMGSDICQEHAAARSIYDRASNVMGYDMAELSFIDPEDQLNLTRFTQPVLLTHSIACLEAFRDVTDGCIKPAMAAGHSVGEYAALVAAEVLDFESALRLVARRGELMGEYGQGEMAAFRMDLDSVRPLALRYYCAVAGCNLPDQTVIGGRSEDLALLEQAVLEQSARNRCVRLKTEGAFHTYYMVKAAQHFRPVLDEAGFNSTELRVLSNFTGDYHGSDPAGIRAGLFFQLFHPVMWYLNLQTAFNDGIDTVIEFGGGIGTASEPDGKRPNLESIVKKALRATGHEAAYSAVINSRTLQEAAEFVCIE